MQFTDIAFHFWHTFAVWTFAEALVSPSSSDVDLQDLPEEKEAWLCLSSRIWRDLGTPEFLIMTHDGIQQLVGVQKFAQNDNFMMWCPTTLLGESPILQATCLSDGDNSTVDDEQQAHWGTLVAGVKAPRQGVNSWRKLLTQQKHCYGVCWKLRNHTCWGCFHLTIEALSPSDWHCSELTPTLRCRQKLTQFIRFQRCWVPHRCHHFWALRHCMASGGPWQNFSDYWELRSEPSSFQRLPSRMMVDRGWLYHCDADFGVGLKVTDQKHVKYVKTCYNIFNDFGTDS